MKDKAFETFINERAEAVWKSMQQDREPSGSARRWLLNFSNRLVDRPELPPTCEYCGGRGEIKLCNETQNCGFPKCNSLEEVKREFYAMPYADRNDLYFTVTLSFPYLQYVCKCGNECIRNLKCKTLNHQDHIHRLNTPVVIGKDNQ